MRLLAYGLHGLVLGFLAVGCSSSAVSGFGSAGGYGGYGGSGGAAGTTGSWTTGTSTGSGGAQSSGSGTSGNVTTSSGSTSSGSTSSSSASSSGSSSSGSSSSSSGADAGSVGNGDCHAAPCLSGQCVAVTPGGYVVCLAPPVPATTCTSALDQCCPTTDPCPGGEACDRGPLVPVCAGIPMVPHNQCAVDQCAKDADCVGSQICALAGTFGLAIRACVAAHCKVDADCSAHPDGMCAPVTDPCCSASDGLFCVYPGSAGCRDSTQCPATTGHPSRYCYPDPVAGVASCQDGGPVCPA